MDDLARDRSGDEEAARLGSDDLETGTRHLLAGRTREAVIALRRSLVVPSHAGHHNLAVALRASGDVVSALGHARAADAIESSAPTLALVASLESLHGDHAKALTTLRRACTIDPTHDVSRYYLGIALATAGDRHGAIAELRHVAHETSRVPASVRARAHVQLRDLLATTRAIAIDRCSVPTVTEIVGGVASDPNASSREPVTNARTVPIAVDDAGSGSCVDRVDPDVIRLDEARALLARANRVVALTGAGISSASGLATRKELWQRFDRDDAVSIAQFRRDPRVLWTVIRDFLGDNPLVPNAAHRALAGFPIITQNVEGLHQAAGSSTVLELHGTLLATRCNDCGARPDLTCRDALDGELPPPCICGGTLRPDVVLFGESVDPALLSRAADLVARCDLLLIVGTAADVAPAADLPVLAARNGATVIEVKRRPSRLTRAGISRHLAGTAEDLLPQLV